MIVDEYTCMKWKLALNVQGAFHGDSILQGLGLSTVTIYTARRYTVHGTDYRTVEASQISQAGWFCPYNLSNAVCGNIYSIRHHHRNIFSELFEAII